MEMLLKTKTCLNCGKQKSLTSFINAQGKAGLICSDCLNAAENSDEGSGGGGFQLDIVDKMAAVDSEQDERAKAAAENHDATQQRIDEQNEHLENQHPKEKSYRTALFAENNQMNTADKNTQKTAKSDAVASGAAAADNKQATDRKEKTENKNHFGNQKDKHYQNSLFSNKDQSQTNSNAQQGTQKQQAKTSERAPNVEKMNSRIQNSLFGTNIPPSEAAMRDAMGESATKTVEGKTESSALDDLATNFIKNLTRGPGR